jgi:predicted transcriptional regulator
MDVIWSLGEACVRDVMLQLPRRPPYTTVMTTLVRLFKKQALRRRLTGRRFVYRAKVTKDEWQKRMAFEAVTRFFATPHVPRDVLVKCLYDVIKGK